LSTELSPPREDLFYEELIRSYIEAPRFIDRIWLAKQIEEALTDPSCRFLLLTAAPGAGKTAFMAWLAGQHSSWPRYFIRRDQRTPLGDVGTQSLLLQIGFQVAASHPALFERQHLQVVIEQRIGEVSSSGEAIAADIDKVFSSPFYQMVVQIRQQIERNSGKVTGIHIGEWITDPRLIPLSTLQHMALLDPAKVMLKESPDKLLVILIDALDELRYRDPEQTLLSWLATCPELPTNVRFVLTSRPDEALLARVRGAQHPWLREMTIEATDPNIQQELRTYALKLTSESEVKAALEAEGQKPDDFANLAAGWACGNIGVLDAVGRAIDQVLLQPDRQAALHQLLDLKQLPNTLEGLFAFFLHQIREMVTRGGKSIAVKDENGKVHYLSPWPTVYLPILGVLTVAREPLTTLQIQNLGAISAGWGDLCEAMDALRQFMNRRDQSYSLYHATLIEFLTDQRTQQKPETRDLYLDEREWHRNITSYYRRIAAETGWNRVENYGLSYVVQHLNLAHEWQQLFALLDDPAFGRAKLRFDPSTRSYAHDLDLGRQATVWEGWTFEESIALLPRMWQYTLLSCSLTSRADKYPEPAFRLLVLLGRKQEAIGLAELLTELANKVRIYMQIAEEMKRQASQESDWHELMMRAVEVAQRIEDRTAKAEALYKLGIAYVEAQELEQARRVCQEAGQVIDTIENSPARSETLRGLAIAYAQAQLWAEAERVIGMIGDGYDQEEALRALGMAYAQAQQWDQAERVIGMIEFSFSQPQALSGLGMAYAQAQHWDQARRTWAEAERVIGMIGNSYLQAEALSALGSAYAEVQQWDQARRVWTEAEQAIKARAQSKVLRDLGILNAIKAHARSKVLRDLGKVYAQERSRPEAEQLIDVIQDLYWRAKVLSELGKAYAQAQQWDQAQRVWAEAERILIPDLYRQAKVLSELGKAYAQAQQWDQAQRVWAEAEQVIRMIDRRDEQTQALSDLVEMYLEAQQWEQAERAIDTIEYRSELATNRRRARAKVLSALGVAYARTQQWDQAQRVWAEAERMISLVEDKIVVEDVGFTDSIEQALSDLQIARVLALEGELAGRLLITMEPGHARNEALKDLGVVYAQKHRWVEAERLIELIQVSHVRAEALSGLGKVYAQEQLWTEAERVIGMIEDSYWQAEALSALGRAYAQEQLWAEAERVIGMIEDSYWRAEALSALGTAYAQVQQWDQAQLIWTKAERLSHTIENDHSRAKALSALGRAYARAQLWESAKRVVHTIKDSGALVEALSDLGRVYAQMQQWKRAQQVWQEAERVIHGIEKGYFQAEALKALGIAYAQAQQWDQAERVIGMMGNSVNQPEALRALGIAYAQVQQWDQAERVIGTIGDSYTQPRALKDLTTEMAKAGQHERLLELIQDSWLHAKTRRQALDLFSLATEFISSQPGIGTAFFEAFSWVGDFLVIGEEKKMARNQRSRYDCSFCGKNQEHVEHLVAGPDGVYICDECVARFADDGDELLLNTSYISAIGEIFHEARDTIAERCSFCSKTPSQIRYIKYGPGQVAICNECIALCQELFLDLTKQEQLDRQEDALLTTRRQGTEPGAQALELGPLPEHDAILFLLRRTKILTFDTALDDASTDDIEAARAITRALGHLPLALDQAGAYILETGCGFAKYLNVFQKHRAELLRRRAGREVPTDHPESVATTFTLNFQQVQQRSKVAVELLRACAFIAPEGIEEELLVQEANRLGPVLRPIGSNGLLLDQAIETLRTFSLIQRDPEEKVLSIHRLVQAVLKDSMNQATRRRWATRVVQIVNAVSPQIKYGGTSKQRKRRLPLLLECARIITEEKIHSKEAVLVLNKCAVYLVYEIRYSEAEKLYEEAIALAKAVLRPQHPTTTAILDNLRLLYYTRKRHEQFWEMVRFLSERWEKLKGARYAEAGETDEESLRSLTALFDTQEGDQIEQLARWALMISTRVSEADISGVAIDMRSLARLLSALATRYREGKHNDTVLMYQQAVAVYEQVSGPKSQDMSIILGNLASYYKVQGKYAEAELLYKQVLSIDTEASTIDAPVLRAIDLCNLAELYYDQGKYEQGESLYEQALEMREEQVWPEFFVVKAYTGLAKCYAVQGLYIWAELLYEMALEVTEQIQDALQPGYKDDLEIAKSVENLANFYFDQGKYEQAEPLYERVLAIDTEEYGPDDPSVTFDLHSLAQVYYFQGKFAEAAPLFERSLTDYKEWYGANDPKLVSIYNHLAKIYNSQGKLAEAELLLDAALEINERVLGSEHLDTAIILYNLAEVYCAQDKYEQAEPFFLRALAIREQAYTAGETSVLDLLVNVLNALTELYEVQGKYEQAEPLIQRALAIREMDNSEEGGLKGGKVASSLIDLATLYEAQGKDLQAKPLYPRAIEVLLDSISSNIEKDFFDDADTLLERILTISEHLTGPEEHPWIFEKLRILANFYWNCGKYQQADILITSAMMIVEQELELDNPIKALYLHRLGYFYEMHGSAAHQSEIKAETLYLRALEIREHALGSKHAETADSLHNLGRLYYTQEKYEQAEPLILRAIAIREEVLGAEHPETGKSLHNLSLVYYKQGKSEQAMQLEQRALTIFERGLGPKDFYTALSLYGLANIYSSLGKDEDVESLYKRSLSIFEEIGGRESLQTKTVQNAYAGFLRQQGRDQEAAAIEQE
jgi:tetratricopeptide (TPR) repeat protein/ribosomal protein L37AE/L43A